MIVSISRIEENRHWLTSLKPDASLYATLHVPTNTEAVAKALREKLI